MNLKELTHREKDCLRVKVGDTELFKARILNSKLNLPDFGIYRDVDDPEGRIYVALKHNPRYHVMDTGVNFR
jgi:hypothetical protein